MSDKLNNIIIFILYLFLFLVTYYVLYGCILFDDDLLSTLYPYKEGVYDYRIVDIIKNPDHGFILSGLFNSIIGNKIPSILDINLQDFHIRVCSLIRAIFIISETYILNKIIFCKNTPRLMLNIASIILSYTSFLYIMLQYPYDLLSWTAFSRITFPLIIVSIITLILNYIIGEKKELRKYELITFYIISFLGGISGELPIIFIFYLYVISNLVYRKKFLIYSFIYFMIGVVITITRPTFYANVAEKFGTENIMNYIANIELNFFEIQKMIKSIYSDIIIGNIIAIIIICIFFIIHLKRKNLKNEIGLIYIYISAIILSIVFLSLIGKTPEYYEAEYWFNHPDSKTTIYMLFCLCCYIIFSKLYREIKYNIMVSIIILINIVLFFTINKVQVYNIYPVKNFYEGISALSRDIKDRAKIMYTHNLVILKHKPIEPLEKNYYIRKNNYIYRYGDYLFSEEHKKLLNEYRGDFKFINLYYIYINKGY